MAASGQFKLHQWGVLQPAKITGSSVVLVRGLADASMHHIQLDLMHTRLEQLAFYRLQLPVHLPGQARHAYHAIFQQRQRPTYLAKTCLIFIQAR